MKFTSDTFGVISGIRFYKASAEHRHARRATSGTRAGQLLATATFTSESASGMAAGQLLEPGPDPAEHDVHRLVLRAEWPLFRDRQLLHDGPALAQRGEQLRQRSAPRASADADVRQRRLQLQRFSTFPNNRRQRDELLGRRRLLAVGTARTAHRASPRTAGYTSATVNWTAPSGGPVTDYVVTPYVGTTPGTPTTVSGLPAPSGVTITGLTNGTTYTFVVVASNPAGTGPPSLPSNAVAPSATASVVINGGFEGGVTPWAVSRGESTTVSSAKAHSGRQCCVPRVARRRASRVTAPSARP